MSKHNEQTNTVMGKAFPFLDGKTESSWFNDLWRSLNGLFAPPPQRILIDFCEDGLSGDAWVRHVTNHLEEGRTVLAVGDTRDPDPAIGVGDGLYSYSSSGVGSYESFHLLRVTSDLDGIKALENRLDELGPDTALCWNMDFIEWLFSFSRPQQVRVVERIREHLGPLIITHFLFELFPLDAAELEYVLSELRITRWEGVNINSPCCTKPNQQNWASICRNYFKSPIRTAPIRKPEHLDARKRSNSPRLLPKPSIFEKENA